MKFKLMQKPARSVPPSGLTSFSVLDEKNAVRGTVSVPTSEAGDLIKCWSGKFEAAKPVGGPSAMAKVLMEKRTKSSKQAILRGY